MRHETSDLLLCEFLAKSFSGEFKIENSFLDTAVTCPESLPGYDTTEIVSSFKVTSRKQELEKITYTIVFRTEAIGSSGEGGYSVFEPTEKNPTVQFVAFHTLWGWRLENPFFLHLSIANEVNGSRGYTSEGAVKLKQKFEQIKDQTGTLDGSTKETCLNQLRKLH